MNFINTGQMPHSEATQLHYCIRCGAEPKLVGTMLDSNKGRTIRIFRCQCGEQIWVSEPA
jgi:formate dehydrogenase maturation protein FdhE